MVSVCLGELGITSFDYLYTMTMTEFNLRFFAYNRQQQGEWLKISELSRHIIWGDVDKNKKNLEKIRLNYVNKEKPTLNEKQIDLFRKALKNE